MAVTEKIARNSHIFEREQHEHYVEPEWVSRRLFDTEEFDGAICDPCCGWGLIPTAARAAGYDAAGTDIVNRGCPQPFAVQDFLAETSYCDNIVSNPPFKNFDAFAQKALSIARRKVAMVWILPRLNAAHWLRDTPLARVYLLTPRPSMPPGAIIARGEKPGGGTADFCWLIWDKQHVGEPELRWLHRDKQEAA